MMQKESSSVLASHKQQLDCSLINDDYTASDFIVSVFSYISGVWHFVMLTSCHITTDYDFESLSSCRKAAAYHAICNRLTF